MMDIRHLARTLSNNVYYSSNGYFQNFRLFETQNKATHLAEFVLFKTTTGNIFQSYTFML